MNLENELKVFKSILKILLTITIIMSLIPIDGIQSFGLILSLIFLPLLMIASWIKVVKKKVIE